MVERSTSTSTSTASYAAPMTVDRFVKQRASPAFRAVVAEHMVPPGPVLDVMGAAGAAARYLAPLGFQVDVLDASAPMLAAGEAASAAWGDRIHYVHADVCAWSSPATYAYAVCRGYTLELLPRAAVPGVLSALRGALLDDGCVLMNWQSPLVGRHRRRLRADARRRLRRGERPRLQGPLRWTEPDGAVLHYYWPWEIRRLLDAAGFRVSSVTSAASLSTPLGSRRRRWGGKLWPVTDAWWVADKA